MNDVQIARVAYSAYGDSVAWKNYRGDPMPNWAELPEAIQKAWIAASAAVVATVCERIEAAFSAVVRGES